MKKIITLTGHKHCQKDIVAYMLDTYNNGFVTWVKPYTDAPLNLGEFSEENGGYTYLSKEELDFEIKNKNVLSITKVNNHRYVYFEEQMTNEWNVIIADDITVINAKEKWKDNVTSVKIVSESEEKSDRVNQYLFDHEFDFIFDVENDCFDDLERELIWA